MWIQWFTPEFECNDLFINTMAYVWIQQFMCENNIIYDKIMVMYKWNGLGVDALVLVWTQWHMFENNGFLHECNDSCVMVMTYISW